MPLEVVTLTGADDSVEPSKLVELADRFEFVEWGILVGSKTGTRRFPSTEWLNELMTQVARSSGVALALHCCGQVLRHIYQGDGLRMPEGVDLSFFKRVQLNWHGMPMKPHHFANTLEIVKDRFDEVIFQLDGVNDWMVDAAREAGLSCSGLFDQSHGAGRDPGHWKRVGQWQPGMMIGYAGGLGPDSITDALPRIREACDDRSFWVDMETNVRSADDERFELDKCERVLSLCQGWV